MIDIYDYLIETYNKTRWRFFILAPLLNIYGEGGRDRLNQLRMEGKVRLRWGVNGKLVELMI